MIVWKVVAEIHKSDERADKNGFMNVLIRAESLESAVSRLKDYVGKFDWEILGIEDGRIVEEDQVFEDDEIQEMFERARANDQAIILGTFHAYKTN